LTVDAAQPVPGPELVPKLAGRSARHQTRNHYPVGGEGRILALLLRLACPRKSQDSSPGFFRQIFAVFRMNLTANPMDINPEVLCLTKKFSCANEAKIGHAIDKYPL
jgi:hypothetical protein